MNAGVANVTYPNQDRFLSYKLIGYADDSTLMAVVPCPGVRVAVACRVPDLGPWHG